MTRSATPTPIITPFGLFKYLFMPFGLTNAAQSFQRLMDKLFRHLPFSPLGPMVANPDGTASHQGPNFFTPPPLGPMVANPDGTASHLNKGTILNLPFSPLGPMVANPDGTVSHQGPNFFTPPPPLPIVQNPNGTASHGQPYGLL